jgi:hypothetical protein
LTGFVPRNRSMSAIATMRYKAATLGFANAMFAPIGC